MDLVEIKVHQSSADNRHPWENARFDFFIMKMGKLINFLDPIVIMDVGCGDAYFIATLKRRYSNIECIGVDINFTEDIKHTLHERYNDVQISLYSSVEEAKSKHAKINLILLMDVIEHIEDDITFLNKEILPVMQSDDAYTFITVPAYQALFTKHDVFLGHYRRYNNALLKKNVTAANIQYTEAGYFFASLIGLRMLEKLMDFINPKRNAEGIANWEGSPFITKLVTNTLIFDYKISNFLQKIGIKMPGLSNYIICKL
jgi:hypothetical protein